MQVLPVPSVPLLPSVLQPGGPGPCLWLGTMNLLWEVWSTPVGAPTYSCHLCPGTEPSLLTRLRPALRPLPLQASPTKPSLCSPFRALSWPRSSRGPCPSSPRYVWLARHLELLDACACSASRELPDPRAGHLKGQQDPDGSCPRSPCTLAPGRTMKGRPTRSWTSSCTSAAPHT